MTPAEDPWDALRSAAGDRESGSAVVAADAADALARIADADDRDVEGAVAELLRGQPAMASCLRLADDVLRATDPAGAARGFARRLERERDGLLATLRSFLPTAGTVVTVSASSTVIDGLIAARARPRVLCAVSEPGGEGRTGAEALRDTGLEAETIPDAVVADAAAEAVLVVFGADAVGPRAMLNKVGTLAAVLGARHGRRLRVAVCGSSKFVGRGAWKRVERAAGPVFAPVPLRLLSHVLTEDGPLAPAAAKKLASRSTLAPRILELLDGAA